MEALAEVILYSRRDHASGPNDPQGARTRPECGHTITAHPHFEQDLAGHFKFPFTS
jgi:hypothetical protein